MTNHRSTRRYRKTSGRRAWVFSELNHDLRPEQVARIITAAGLEQARREAEARASHESEGPYSTEQGGDHA
ncbi:hypothetical protein [Microbacterium capsulatum]|uniref:Uncharacterized protein n=1 Tax=Microbacterium capsulatum TaxID=3041921 RepID=A0ABU0XF60_9MICO|nr:hypothetical protein [Microbacterium sp. ASV81]MDQ4213751.1 hypothetical protein [Microbacterium sp. ASV81]